MPHPAIAKQDSEPAAGRRFALRAGLLRWLPWGIVAGGMLVTFSLAAHLREQEQMLVRQEFRLRAMEMASALERRLNANMHVLRGVVGLFAASAEVDRDEFRRYVLELRLEERFPGIQGVGFAKYVAPGTLAAHEAAIRARGHADFAVKPAGRREVHTSIIYLEPFDWRNQRALGYDMYSEPVRRAAMERARDLGQPAMTGRVTLVQEAASDIQPGFLIYVPVFRNGAPADTPAERRAALLGWAFSPIRVGNMVHAFLASEFPEQHRRIGLTIRDGSQPAEGMPLFDSAGVPEDEARTHRVSRSLDVGGRQWIVEATPLQPLDTGTGMASAVALAAGLVLTAAFAAFHWKVSSAHGRIAHALRAAAQANTLLGEREALLRLIYDTSSVAIFLVDTAGHITHANRRMAEMFRCPMDSLIGSEYVAHVHPAERDTGRQRMLQLIAEEVPAVMLERLYWREDQSEFWGLLTGQPMRDADGKVTGLVGVIADISDRKKVEAATQLARTVFDASTEGIIVTDAGNKIVSVNPAFTEITGYAESEVVGHDPSLLSAGRQGAEFFKDMWAAIETGGQWRGELWNRRKNGETYPATLSISKVTHRDGSVANYIGIFQDITARRRAEDRIRHLAHHDYLTGLPNRAFLMERTAQAVALARRYQRRMAILFVDLDRFKPINDEHGHDAGDAVLREIANRLRENVRESDTVCRQGGDEFVVLVPELGERDRLGELARKLADAIAMPIPYRDKTLRVTASIGIAIFPEHGDTVDTLVRSADSAMYCSKADGEHEISFAASRQG